MAAETALRSSVHSEHRELDAPYAATPISRVQVV